MTADGLPYAAGKTLSSTADHVRKLNRAWRHIQRRHADGLPLHNASGLSRGLPLPDDVPAWVYDDEWAGALYSGEVRERGLEHLGGDSDRDDIVVTNRLTAALFAALQVTVRLGSTVIGVSRSYSHPAVARGVRDAGGTLVDTVGVEEFESRLAAHDDVSVVVLTRLAVTYLALDESDIRRIVDAAHRRGALVVVDDAGGARVGPAMLGQPRTLELGADLGATGLDKYGVDGPRVGLLGGRADLIDKARARAFELGSECRPVLYPAVARTLRDYHPERVRALVASTRTVGDALAARFGADAVEATPFIAKLSGEVIARILAERADRPVDLAPVEATAALAMCLLRDRGILTVHFAGLPPGTSALLVKFMSSTLIAEIGGADAFAAAVDDALTAAAREATPEALPVLLFG
ncbi:MAG TPA: hypothetical protein VE172_15215 [Stackebrandtia sp.]|jgi:L-seryl-tRNA(Ser) seleniumtransferase|uniref:hypothetical protein n=1 Tax=Stackebrandtia sp. TaxID=2023065 RepID=UPI002D237675|nr:hypothetical protein [Stackebrandtia sp.]HZE40156.1 hypothetical protein [Stackebrandtia sp.]